MLECINCGHVQITDTCCSVCGGSLIPALSKEAAKEELVTRLQHHGIELDEHQIDQLIAASY